MCSILLWLFTNILITIMGKLFTDDSTRVPLGSEDGYINASFINMPVGNEEFTYIACQGPLPSTVPDFWQMVWEQNATVISMMTQEMEGGKIKCQRYWPEELHRPVRITNELQLTLVKTQQLESFILRVVELQDVQVRTGNRTGSAQGGFKETLNLEKR